MTTNFLAEQTRAKRKTAFLVAYFMLGFLTVAASVFLAAALMVVFLSMGKYLDNASFWLFTAWASGIAGSITILIMLATILVSAERLSQDGGRAVAKSLDGRPVPPDTTDPGERRLLNVVEEMSLASGLPVPPVYVLDQQRSINALVAGFNPQCAVIIVTKGLLEHLNREELTGVVGHEFSHILNGDMRLNIRLMSLASGILVLRTMGESISKASYPRVLREAMSKTPYPSRWGKGAPAGMVAGALLEFIGFGGTHFSKRMLAAVSREREFLADAASVQFTRNPTGLCNALAKIARSTHGSSIRHRLALNIGHMLFGQGQGTASANRLDTHPPIVERILRLDPSFRLDILSKPLPEAASPADPGPEGGRTSVSVAQEQALPVSQDQPSRGPLAEASARAAEAARQGSVKAAMAASAAASARQTVRAILDKAKTGNAAAPDAGPTLPQLLQVKTLIRSLPEAVLQATRDTASAQAVVLGLLVLHDPRQDQTLLDLLAELANPPVHEATVALLPELQAVPDNARLPLIDLCIPALRQMTPQGHQDFMQSVHGLITSDLCMDLMEWALSRLLKRRLDSHFRPGPCKLKTLHFSLQPVQLECSVLLATLAGLGRDNGQDRLDAYEAGIKTLGMPGLELPSKKMSTLVAVDQALTTLNRLDSACKDTLLAACAACVIADKEVSVQQGELLRVIADSLDRPMPPFAA